MKMKTKKIISYAFAILLVVANATGCAQQSASEPEKTASVAAEPAPEQKEPAPEATELVTESEEPASEPTELIIAAAMSLKDVTEELAVLYNTQFSPNVTLTFTYGASGALQAQIEEGAPTDIFMSAAPKQMNALADKGMILGESRNLLSNEVVLIVPADSQAGIESFADVGTNKVKTIAFGDPAAVPIGVFAQEIFTGLGIIDEVTEKVNLSSDVRQTLTWVEMDEIDCGIVFRTDAITTDKVKIAAAAEQASHSPSIYPVGIIESSSNHEEAGKFIDFLFSDAAKAVFENAGFSVIQ